MAEPGLRVNGAAAIPRRDGPVPRPPLASRQAAQAADDNPVKGLEKMTSVRLAEILADRAVVSGEAVTDALYAQDQNGEPFAQVLISGGHITEWDLAKLVTECFNLPFLLAGNYQISEAAKERLPKEVLFRHTLVPLDVFDDAVCVAMPVMLTFDEIQKIQKEHNCELFPYVGLLSENKKLLGELWKDYPQWLEQEQKRRESETKQKQKPQGPAKVAGGDWMSIFDAGDQAAREGLKKRPPAPPPAPAEAKTPIDPKAKKPEA